MNIYVANVNTLKYRELYDGQLISSVLPISYGFKKTTGVFYTSRLIISQYGNEIFEVYYITSNDPDLSIPFNDFFESIVTRLTYNFNRDHINRIRDEVVILNIDDFNERSQDIKIYTTGFTDDFSIKFISNKQDFKIVSNVRGDTPSLKKSIKLAVERNITVSNYPISFFSNIDIINNILYPNSTKNIIEADNLDQYRHLINRKLPKFNTVFASDDDIDTILSMCLLLMKKLQKQKTINFACIEFKITVRYCQISFFGIRYRWDNDQSKRRLISTPGVQYVIGYLQTFENFTKVLDKLEMQLLL